MLTFVITMSQSQLVELTEITENIISVQLLTNLLLSN